MCERTTPAGILEFLPGGSRSDCQKTVLTCFFSPQLILQMVSNGYFKKNYNFPWFQRGGGQHLPGGGGGVSKC